MFWKVSLPKAHFNVRSVEVFIVCPKTVWKPPPFFCMPPKNSTPKHHPIGPKDRSDNWSCRANPQRSVTAPLVNQGKYHACTPWYFMKQPRNFVLVNHFKEISATKHVTVCHPWRDHQMCPIIMFFFPRPNDPKVPLSKTQNKIQ